MSPPVTLRQRIRRRVGRILFGRALMGIWIVLPLFPVLGVVATWWLGIHQ